MSETNQLLREVNEELKREQWLKFWKLVAPYVIGAMATVIAVTGGTVGWQSYREARDREWGENYGVAMQLAAEGNNALAIERFAELSADASPGSGYATLSAMQEAALLADQGKLDEAAALYLRLRDEADDPALRGLVIVLRAFIQLDTAPAVDLRADLEPLNVSDNPWRFSARELLGYLAAREGDRPLQVEIFKGLIDDPLTPQGIYARSREILSILGEDHSG